ncbi:MAG TPA: ABC transporter ATP-binding protein [Steroidobacteraceae bacterium]|nr:ABC transporter ATP-binding protein [Steroidobacteraceae bacterium]
MSTEQVLEAKALTKRAGGKQILKGLNLSMHRGEVVGLLGKNGAGKSTLMDVLLGFALPTHGESRVFGDRSDCMRPATKSRVGFVPQSDELMGPMTARQHLTLTASFYDHWDWSLIQRLAADWQVPLDLRISALSGGERQKVATLMALGHRPELLVMDEPASGLDPVARRQFMRTILDIASDSTRTILYSSHIVADIERTASHIWVMREGEMVWKGELDRLKESVVRIRIRSDRDLDPALKLPGQLTLAVSGRNATAVVTDWSAERATEVEQLSGAPIEMEALGLEEIFLAVHA